MVVNTTPRAMYGRRPNRLAMNDAQEDMPSPDGTRRD
jgi:hypothetical protein